VTLAAAIEALHGSTRPPDEVIVVEEPAGYNGAQARNDGALRATGDLLLFVDADVCLHPDAIARIEREFAEDPGLAAMFGSYDDHPQAAGTVSRFRNLLHHHVHQAGAGSAQTFWTGIGAVRRDVFRAAGGFDGSLDSIADIDLGLRLSKAGEHIRLEPGVQGTHLKRWTLREMLFTDCFVRAVPWLRLLARHRHGISALNLGWRHRLSALLALALAAVLVAAAAVGAPTLALAALLPALAFVTLNRRFYTLLAGRLGLRAAASGALLHALHHLAASIVVLLSAPFVAAGLLISANRAPPRPVPAMRWSAETTLDGRQAALGVTAGLALAAALVLDTTLTLTLLVTGFTLVFVLTTWQRLVYSYRGFRRGPSAHAPLAEPRLPAYTVLVALYKEANVVPRLAEALAAIAYPRDRLQVVLLTEEDDPETLEACLRHRRPEWEVLAVPAGAPRTKPRALNAGLALARGELITIFDAEDEPATDQLKRAAAAFASHPERVACVQAELDYYNESDNALTRWFGCEYAAHFGLHLAGIAASGHAMPLGGTSTHFRTKAVRDVGGWDAWNVTEDCDLGMRLAASGYRAEVIDSVTHEEAVARVRPWLRQRSRWVKGYAQTALAMTRNPIRSARAMGPGRYAAALLNVAGVPLVLCSQIVFWALLLTYFGLREGGADVSAIEALFPGAVLALGVVSLMVGNFAVLLFHVAAVYQRERFALVSWALVLPVYWVLASLGAWRGMAQLVWRPHFWEKTAHGISARHELPQPAAAPLFAESEPVSSPSGAGP
jgi:glycosyltransferase XagB